MVETNEARLLPILKVDGIEYLVDVERREFRELKNPASVIHMHSKRGRKIVEQSRGKQWPSFGLAKPAAQSSENMIACEQCDNGIAVHT